MNLIDAHCHLTYEPFADIDAILKRSKDAGVTGWITIGSCIWQTAKKQWNWQASLKICSRPWRFTLTTQNQRTSQQSPRLKNSHRIKKSSQSAKQGLDLHYDFSTPQQQQDSFLRHLEIAKELKLPVVIHSREAFDETMEILEANESGLKRLVFHCYSGNCQQTGENHFGQGLAYLADGGGNIQ